MGNDKIVIELSLERTKFERNAAEKRNEGEGEDWKYRSCRAAHVCCYTSTCSGCVRHRGERQRERGVPLDPGSVCAAYELTYEPSNKTSRRRRLSTG